MPDHSTFSKNRHGRFRDCDLLRRLFEATVARCMAEGLVGGEGFAVDASLIRADVSRQHTVDNHDDLPPGNGSHPVREYLAVLDDAAFGAATPVVPKQLAVADPAARWTAASRGRAFFPYSTKYLIDLDHAVIVDVEATTAVRQAEVTAQRRMIERAHERFGLLRSQAESLEPREGTPLESIGRYLVRRAQVVLALNMIIGECSSPSQPSGCRANR